MAQSREAKAESHKAIVHEAARLFRKHGIESTSVADVMQAAHLTHGGFYRHFKSKDELAAEAVGAAFDDMLAWIEEMTLASGACAAVKAYAEAYLSPESVSSPELSCPVPALGNEVARLGGPVAEATADRIDKTLDVVSAAFEDAGPLAREKAAQLMATLVGAVMLARAAGGSPVAGEILASCRKQLETLLAER